MTFGAKSLMALVTLIVVGSTAGAYAAGNAASMNTGQTTEGPVTVHWSLQKGADRVQASGIVEAGDPVQEVTLEFVALDSAGQVVGRSQEIVDWGFDQNRPQSFSAQLPTDPRAEAYEVRILGYGEFDEHQ